MDFLKNIYFEMMVWQWMVLVGGSIVLMFVLELIIGTLIKRTNGFVSQSKTDIDDLLKVLAQKVTSLTLFAISLWLFQLFLPLPSGFIPWIRVIFLCLMYLQIGHWVTPIYKYIFRKLATDEEGNPRQASLKMVVKIMSWISYVLLVVMAVDALPNVDATALITTMGIGGIAVAFALQNVLSDFAAAMTIAFDQPFREGDALVVDGVGGTVEKIGLKSTRLRSWDGQEIILSNSDLLNSRINNYKTLERRRVVMNFGVVYQTTAVNLARIPGMLEDIITNYEQVSYDRTHSTTLNDSSIAFECVYYVDSADFNLFMDRRHQINLDILHRFEEQGIELAYPTRTVILEKFQ